MRKQNLLLLAAGFLLAASTTLTSCGGDDDDEFNVSPNTPEQPEGGQGSGDTPGSNETSYGYIEPYLQWGASHEQVVAWMKSNTSDFLSTIDMPTQLTYTRYKPYTQVTYMIPAEDYKLMMVSVSYFECKDSASLLSMIEKSYGCKLQVDPDNDKRFYADGVVINSKKTNIKILVNDFIVVQFQLDE